MKEERPGGRLEKEKNVLTDKRANQMIIEKENATAWMTENKSLDVVESGFIYIAKHSTATHGTCREENSPHSIPEKGGHTCQEQEAKLPVIHFYMEEDNAQRDCTRNRKLGRKNSQCFF